MDKGIYNAHASM